ncbi:MAG: thioredoxin family protein [Bacteroidota bacterium]
MKLIAILTTICLGLSTGFGADTTINFRQISYSEIFEVAKQENKRVLLYFHFEGCRPCREMEKTVFIDEQVANFYNENFVCLKINTMEEAGIEVKNTHQVKINPAFLFFDQNENLLNRFIGSCTSQELISHAQKALSPTQNLRVMKESYQKGNRAPDFLFDYTYRLRDANQVDSAVINQYLRTQSFEELAEEHNLKFIYEFTLHKCNPTLQFGGRAFHFMLENRNSFSKYFKLEQVETRIAGTAILAAQQAVTEQDESTFNKAIEVLREFDNGKAYFYKKMDGGETGMFTSKSWILEFKMAYYEKSGSTELYNEALEQFIGKIWDDAYELNSIAWNFYKKYDDKDRLALAKTWSIRSIELNDSYANIDTYASLLYKLGDYESALKQAERAIAVAKQEKKEYQETEALITRIKEKMNK